MQNRILQVDINLETRDVFRASLYLARTRLIVGACVCAAAIAAIVGLFVAMGEREMLLETSALFIGFPLLALFGQILRLRAASKKYVAGLPEARRHAHFIFQDDGDGFDVVYGSSFNHVGWDSVSKVVERPGYFLFHLDAVEVRILPAANIPQEEKALLRELLSSHLGRRAKLLAA